MVQLTSVLRVLALSVAALATLSPTRTAAHPGEAAHHHETRSLAEIAQRRLFHQNAHRSLVACTNRAASRQLNAQAAARREAKIAALRADKQRQRQRQRERHLTGSQVAAVTHKSDLTGVTQDSFDLVTLFGSTNKCVLEPIVTEGPYYVSGELLRTDVRESEPGVDLYAELQFINVNTCEPVPDYYVDFWHSNSSGVYAGVVASGNGNGADLTNINTTHGRGVFPTDDDGVVQFVTKFPGHYDGRATHIHVMGHYGGTLLPNNTYAGGSVGSVGQIFFDQDLLVEVNANAPYSEITADFVLNTNDNIFNQAAATGFDPILEYVALGDSAADGIFGWLSIGVDPTSTHSVSNAATWTANGGVANANNNFGGGGPGGSGMGGGPGGPGGSGMGFPGSGMGPTPPGGAPSAGSAGVAPTPTTTTATGSVAGDATPSPSPSLACASDTE